MNSDGEVVFDRSRIGQTFARLGMDLLSGNGEKTIIAGDAGTGDLQASLNLIHRMAQIITESYRRADIARAEMDNLRNALRAARLNIDTLKAAMGTTRTQQLLEKQIEGMGANLRAANDMVHAYKRDIDGLQKELAQTKLELMEKAFPLTPGLNPGYLQALRTKPAPVRAVEAALAADDAAEDGDWKAVRQLVNLAQIWTQLFDVEALVKGESTDDRVD